MDEAVVAAVHETLRSLAEDLVLYYFRTKDIDWRPDRRNHNAVFLRLFREELGLQIGTTSIIYQTQVQQESKLILINVRKLQPSMRATYMHQLIVNLGRRLLGQNTDFEKLCIYFAIAMDVCYQLYITGQQFAINNVMEAIEYSLRRTLWNGSFGRRLEAFFTGPTYSFTFNGFRYFLQTEELYHIPTN